MQQNLLKYSSNKFFAAFLALFFACFIFANISSVIHGFSHKISAEFTLLSSNILLEDYGDKTAPVKHSQHHDNFHCLLCSSFISKEKLFAPSVIFAAILSFVLSFNARIFDRIKWSYLSSSFSSRAPPANF